MTLKQLILLALVFSGCTCSSSSQDDDPDDDATGNAGSTGGQDICEDTDCESPTFGSSMQPGQADDPDARNCDTLGDRRDATKDEQADHCVCSESMDIDHDGGTETRAQWRCYGPNPEADPVGGTGAPVAAECGGATSLAGRSPGNCLFLSNCEGFSYTVSCLDHSCLCLVDNMPTAELEPMDACPASVQKMSDLCGWDLQYVGGESFGGPSG